MAQTEFAQEQTLEQIIEAANVAGTKIIAVIAGIHYDIAEMDAQGNMDARGGIDRHLRNNMTGLRDLVSLRRSNPSETQKTAPPQAVAVKAFYLLGKHIH